MKAFTPHKTLISSILVIAIFVVGFYCFYEPNEMLFINDNRILSDGTSGSEKIIPQQNQKSNIEETTQQQKEQDSLISIKQEQNSFPKVLQGDELDLDHIPKVFIPGSLKLPASEVLRKCHFDPTLWKDHRGKYQCVISDEAKMVYYHVPKSGSSTNRRKFRGHFDGKDGSVFCGKGQQDKILAYRAMTAVREPLGRFYSQFMEAEWRANRSSSTHNFAKLSEWKIEDEEKRFEAYVEYWYKHGYYKLLDTHLRLQAPMFTWIDGSIRPLDWLVKMETIDEDWEVLLKYFGKEIPKEIELARKNYHRALNDTNVSDEVKQKICQIAAPDYCCLNYKLPKVCEGVVWCTYKPRIPLRNDAMRIIQPLLPDLNKKFDKNIPPSIDTESVLWKTPAFTDIERKKFKEEAKI